MAADETLLPLTHCALFSHAQYTPAEKVNLWVNKVGPYHNPQETYEYFSLPYCKVRLLEAQRLCLCVEREGLGIREALGL